MSKKPLVRERKTTTNGWIPIIPPIENYSSRREWEENSLLKILESKKLLSMLLTSYERVNLVIRAAIIDGLAMGKGHRQLSRKLSVSLQTINSVKKAIAENNYRSYSERSKKERKKKEYSPSPFRLKTKRRGRPVRTKYGTIYIPH